MEKRLYDAAVEGDVTTLHQLLLEDPLVLDRAALKFEDNKCFDRNPLHIAAILGNVDFVEAILQVHSAYFMCLARDRDGRNPLHLAAIHGRLEVLQELIHAGKQAALEKTDGGGTILHLCIKYNQLEALKILVDKLKDLEFVNAKNEDGMTILHLAVYYEQDKTIKYLLKEATVGVNIKNANGKTALDLLLAQGHINPEIQSALKESKASKGKNVRPPDEERKNRQQQLQELIEKSRDAIMVVASLIATMAFQVGISPPGGVWQDDSSEGPNPHKVGEAIMAQTYPMYYRQLIRATNTAFVSSLTTIILLMRGSGIPSLYLMTLLSFVMAVAVISIALTYAISLVAVAPKQAKGGRLSDTGWIVLIVVMMWSCSILSAVYEICVLIKKSFKEFVALTKKPSARNESGLQLENTTILGQLQQVAVESQLEDRRDVD